MAPHPIAIDAHTHINHSSRFDTRVSEIYTADLEDLMCINDAAGVGKMLCSTFSSVLSAEDVEAENEYMFELAQKHGRLYQWVVIDPRNERTFEQADRMLGHGKCVGIKLHTGNHGYTLAEYGDRLFSFSSKHGAAVLIHPENPPYTALPFANRYPDTTFIIAHLGSVEHVNAIADSRYDNVYTDTSGIASSRNNVVEYAVGRVGSERILFGTDTYAAGFQRGRIEYARISEADKQNILAGNALRLFGDLIGPNG